MSDRRLEAAKSLVGTDPDSAYDNALADLLDFAEERLRVNVGLVRETTTLRRKVEELSHKKENDEAPGHCSCPVVHA